MKRIFNTIINGYMGLLFPLIMTIILLEKLHHLISPLVMGIESKLHISRMLGVVGVILISALIMLLLGFLCGLLIKSSWVKKQIKKYEENVLEKIPIYNLLKSLFGSGTQKNKNDFRPALLSDGTSFSLCYVTGECNDFYTVFICDGGLGGGELRLVPNKDVRLLDMHLSEFTRLIKQYGVGSANYAEILSKATQPE